MTAPVRQHLIDPELCIRCYTCESMCTVGAISHDDVNVVVDAEKCNSCMDCIGPCPTGSIDNWRIVDAPYSLEEQLSWSELPVQAERADDGDAPIEAHDAEIEKLLAEAHGGAGAKLRAPRSATKPTVNLYTLAKPAQAIVQGNYRLTASGAENDVRHIILDLGAQPFPGARRADRRRAAARRSTPRASRICRGSIRCRARATASGPTYNNLSLTVKREAVGVASNFLCDLKKGDKVESGRAVRRDLPDAERSEGEAADDLHRHRLGAVPRLHHAPAARGRGIYRADDAGVRRAHGLRSCPISARSAKCPTTC